jgi:hypothetical protein
MKRIIKKLAIAIGITLVSVVLIYVSARYGWRLFGFNACANTIFCSKITVENGVVDLYGGTADSISSYVGYIHKIKDGNLYIGTKFNTFLGFSDRDGGFHIVLKPKEEFERIYFVGSRGVQEKPIWVKGE